MNITFCGGAREVGASCYLLRIDDKNILLDCGIRMKGSDNLPDFRLIQHLGGVDAVIVSHAHLDHSGALPVISREYPEARIYMTHASKALIRVLLYDSLKIMERDEADIPIYAEKHVVEMLDRVICYSPQYDFKLLPESNIKVSFYNAGHITGAALVYIQAEEGTVLYTGDFSAGDQQTVIGCSVPKLRPDVMISESTYGDKLHSNRDIEEGRLVETVRKVIERKGKMLIPAFALGRAQEIIQILRRAQNKKELPEFKIYIDGMVRAINRVYKLHPNYLQPRLAKKIFRGNDIFYNDNIIEIEDHEMREELVEDEGPYCIISSSGMLKGGPSSYYAEQLVDDEKNFIAITGYQDEEAPGSDILDLLESDEEEKELVINNKKLTVNCDFNKYGLSAHSDKGELLGLMHRVAPRKVFLVHGDESVIEKLALEANEDLRTEVYVPKNGEDYGMDFSNPRKQLDYSKDVKPIYGGEELNEDNIEKLWEYLYHKTGTDNGYSIEEIIYIQEGIENFHGREDKIDRYREILNNCIYFSPNRRRLFLYHPVSEEKLAEKEGPMEMNEMFDVVDEIFPQESGLYKKGARVEENIVILNFNFPDAAREKYKDTIEELKEKTEWNVEINEECNQMALEDMVYKMIPAAAGIEKISYYHSQDRCEVSLNGEIDKMEEIAADFKETTGIDLIVETPEEAADSKKQEELSLKEVDESEMMEQNRAFNYIDDVFEPLDVRIYKKSRKEAEGIPYLEIYFISPEIGRKYKDVVQKLEEDTGWNIKIGSTPIQNEIINLARRMAVSSGLRLKSNPGLYTDKALAKLEVDKKASKEVLEDMGGVKNLKKEFLEKTGYSLEIETR